jgi:chaperone BCS1
MDTLLSYYQQFMELSMINPMMGGLVGVWIAAVTTYLFRNVPLRVWGWIKRNSTRHLQLTSVGPNGDNKSYNRFLDWFTEEKKRTRFVRSWQFTTFRDSGSFTNQFSAGYSRHYFFYKWHLCWFSKTQLDSQGTDKLKEQISITVLFGSQAFLESFVDEFKWKPAEKVKRVPDILVYKQEGNYNYWDDIKKLSPRHLNTVAIRKSTREEILKYIWVFQEAREWYLKRGIPFKLSIELTGPSGTGKTSLVRAIATYFNMDLYIVRLNEFRDKDLVLALSKIPANAIVLVEDYDSCEALLDRKKFEAQLRQDASSEMDYQMSKRLGSTSGPTLAGVLNAFDGVIPLDGQIIFWTTNHPEKIDSAVRRKGRMDHSYELGELEHDDIKDFIEGLLPDAKLPEGKFAPISGSKLSSLLPHHADDLQKFVDSIPYIAYVPEPVSPRGLGRPTLIIDEATYPGDVCPSGFEPDRGVMASIVGKLTISRDIDWEKVVNKAEDEKLEPPLTIGAAGFRDNDGTLQITSYDAVASPHHVLSTAIPTENRFPENGH